MSQHSGWVSVLMLPRCRLRVSRFKQVAEVVSTGERLLSSFIVMRPGAERLSKLYSNRCKILLEPLYSVTEHDH